MSNKRITVLEVEDLAVMTLLAYESLNDSPKGSEERAIFKRVFEAYYGSLGLVGRMLYDKLLLEFTLVSKKPNE